MRVTGLEGVGIVAKWRIKLCADRHHGWFAEPPKQHLAVARLRQWRQVRLVGSSSS